MFFIWSCCFLIASQEIKKIHGYTNIPPFMTTNIIIYYILSLMTYPYSHCVFLISESVLKCTKRNPKKNSSKAHFPCFWGFDQPTPTYPTYPTRMFISQLTLTLIDSCVPYRVPCDFDLGDSLRLLLRGCKASMAVENSSSFQWEL